MKHKEHDVIIAYAKGAKVQSRRLVSLRKKLFMLHVK